MSESAKIGVFFCNCGKTISERIDIKKLKEEVQSAGGVQCIEEFESLCRKPEQEKLSSLMKKEGVERVVIAGCSPKLYEELFARTLKEAGINPEFLVISNIREQCSWVFPEKDTATRKALEDIRQKVSRAKSLEAFDEVDVPAEQKVLAIGGGIAGLETALELSKLGFKVTLIEKSSALGGRTLKLNKSYVIEENPKDYVQAKVDLVNKDDNIEILTETELVKLNGSPGNFTAKIKQSGEKKDLNVGAIVVATGLSTRFPRESYGIDLSEKVVTQLQLEEILASPEKSDARFKGDNKAHVLFVTGMIGEDSKLSTASALKNALLLKGKYDCLTYVACQEMKVAGDRLEEMYRKAREEGVIFFKYNGNPPSFVTNGSEIKAVVSDYFLSAGEKGIPQVKIPCDLLVLEENLVPTEDFAALRGTLDIKLGPRGFFQQDNVHQVPVKSNKSGIFLVGSCRQPMDIVEVLADAGSAATQIVSLLSPGKIKVNDNRWTIEKGKCTLCLTCVRFCPHGAIGWTRAAEASEGLCQACGVCASECPAIAIQVKNYTNDQILTELEEILNK
ncbi:MAG: CoB--CoM heterodisulfide reductase iron-sulfur subunit A family protein [Deltaproteobacteria bacterium]|nr:MAG: CoB--CoM heterodisulfide reductase iron-sulfur subunit A family protein [Deltaproteobacteria bacterium]